MLCLGVVLFGANLFGTFCASWTCMSISFAKLGKFSFIISSKKFSISCSFSSLSVNPVVGMFEVVPEAAYAILLVLGAGGSLFSSCSD